MDNHELSLSEITTPNTNKPDSDSEKCWPMFQEWLNSFDVGYIGSKDQLADGSVYLKIFGELAAKDPSATSNTPRIHMGSRRSKSWPPLACFLYYLKRKNPLFKFDQIDGPALPRKLKEVFTILLLAISYCPDNLEFTTKMQTLKIETQQLIEQLIIEGEIAWFKSDGDASQRSDPRAFYGTGEYSSHLPNSYQSMPQLFEGHIFQIQQATEALKELGYSLLDGRLSSDDEIQSLVAELDSSKLQIAVSEQSKEEAKKVSESLRKENERLEEEMGSIAEDMRSLKTEHVAEICRFEKKIETMEEKLINLRGELQDLKATNESLLEDLRQSQAEKERMSRTEGFTDREKTSDEADQFEAMAGTDVHDEDARMPFKVGQRKADIPEIPSIQESGKAGPFKTIEDISTKADVRNEGAGFVVGEHNENAPSPSNVFRHGATENSEELPLPQQFEKALTASSGPDIPGEHTRPETVKVIFMSAGDISEDTDDDDMAEADTEDPQLTPQVEHHEAANTTEQTPREFPSLDGEFVSGRPSMLPIKHDNQGMVVSVDPAAKAKNAELLKCAGVKRQFPAVAGEEGGPEKKKQKHEAEKKKPIYRKQKRKPERGPEKGLQESTAPRQYSFSDFFQQLEDRRLEFSWSPDKGLRTAFSYYTRLSQLYHYINQHSELVDVIAVATQQNTSPVRANGGPRDYYTIFKVIDRSLLSTATRVCTFWPCKEGLPTVSQGDCVLLVNFTVKSKKHASYLYSGRTSAWCVWKTWGSQEQPARPVEFGEEEEKEMGSLKRWWLFQCGNSVPE